MPTAIVCPNCRRPQVPREVSGRRICPDCSAALPPGLFGADSSGESDDPRSSTSALDLPASGQPRPSGSITLLRSGLRGEEKNQQGGWMEGLFARRGKGPEEKVKPPAGPVERGPAEESDGSRMSRRTTRIDSPPSEEVPSRPAPRPDVVAMRPRHEASPLREGSPAGRVPISGILASLMVAPVSTVALLRGRGEWADSLFLMTAFLLGVSILGILHRHQARRAFWQGFALFGWGYLAMAFAPWPPPRTGLELPTSRLIATLHSRVDRSAEAPPVRSPRPTAGPGLVETLPETGAEGLGGRPQQAASMFVAGDLPQFQRVGHCLFALLAALLGSGIAGWFHRSNPGLA